MASTRLTVAMRDAITDAVMKHAFADRCRKHMEAELAFVDQVYNDVLDTRMLKVDQGHGPKMSLRKVLESMPAGWTSQQTYFKVQFAGQDQKLDRYDGIPGDAYKPNSAMIGWKETAHRDKKNWHFPPVYAWGTLHVYDANTDTAKRATELQNAREDLLEEMSSVRASTRATLNSATTIQKLIVLWPEIEAFAAPFMQERKAAEVLLPVVQREKLNVALGLPPGEKVAARPDTLRSAKTSATGLVTRHAPSAKRKTALRRSLNSLRSWPTQSNPRTKNDLCNFTRP